MGDLSLESKGIFFIVLLISITMHEFGHAFAADKLGDRLPRSMGRVTLNPLAHADMVGTIILPLVMIFSGAGLLFGWGKPVYTSLPNPKTRMRDDLISTAAGPLMNLILAFISTLLYVAGIYFKSDFVQEVGVLSLQVNCALFIFNMIPIPPLDGSHFLRYMLKVSNETYAKIQQYGFLILLVLIFLTPFRMVLSFAISFLLGIFATISDVILKFI